LSPRWPPTWYLRTIQRSKFSRLAPPTGLPMARNL